jgi:hypothetical protein
MIVEPKQNPPCSPRGTGTAPHLTSQESCDDVHWTGRATHEPNEPSAKVCQAEGGTVLRPPKRKSDGEG